MYDHITFLFVSQTLKQHCFHVSCWFKKPTKAQLMFLLYVAFIELPRLWYFSVVQLMTHIDENCYLKNQDMFQS